MANLKTGWGGGGQLKLEKKLSKPCICVHSKIKQAQHFSEA